MDVILTDTGMCRKEYILIPALLSFMLNCTSDRVIQRNTSGNRNNTSNELNFDWASNNNDDYNELYTREEETDFKHGKTIEQESITGNRTNLNISKINKSPGKDVSINKNISKNTKKESNERIVYKNKLYKIKKGDNLFKVSRKFDIPYNDLLKVNKIKNSDKIFEGMFIKIPVKTIQKDSAEITSNNNQKCPDFNWPIKEIYASRQDGADGIKSIGIIITGKTSCSVLASADGKVSKIGSMRGFGNYVIIKHLNKYLTIYSNLKEINVTEGDIIKRGKAIGRIDGNRLHFQIGHSGKPVNPLKYLSKET